MTQMLHLAGLGRVDAALEDRAALVNGSATEFGLAIADALAAQGAIVAIHDLGGERVIETQSRELSSRHDVSLRYADPDVSEEGPFRRKSVDAHQLMLRRAKVLTRPALG